tara:strand:- start:13861 stop:16917 length:3057 start_codon:yes stop_codon:yes gene_type:complete
MKFPTFNHAEIEPAILQFWQKNNTVPRLRQRNKNGEKFYFLEGPPYTSGRVHIGTAWQTSMKDIILRFKRMKGFKVWDRMGYDMHGLPTEQKVTKKFNLKNKDDIEKFGLKKFTHECTKWCEDMMAKMNEDFIRLGITMDFSNPYQPIKKEFMEAEWWLIKQAHEKGRLYQGLRTMHWDAATQSAVAKHELEYKSVKDKSIYVKFQSGDRYFVIWTTTPWTIPLNLAMMVNPDLDYADVEVKGEVWVIAKELVELVMQKADVEEFKILKEYKGSELEGQKYVHPLPVKEYFPEELRNNPKLFSILLSKKYVDLSAGTGLVHCAPGCGPEDYEVGHQNGIPPFNCVNEEGIFENLGEYSGWKAKGDDLKFIEALGDSVVAKESYIHDYPHGERSHEPVIFRTTKQWFFKVEDLKEKMIAANDEISWNPPTAKNAFHNWLNNLRDNSITKQRYWGTPVPIWQAEDGDYIVVGSVKELEDLSGMKVGEMHIPDIDAITISKDGKLYKRIPDVLDVWIDAGTASWNCLDFPHREDYFKEFFPADFILEGKDQIRGWFNLLMVASMLAFEKPSFKNVYMNGFVTDVDGVKMSKSLGNIISPDQLIEKHGADVLRYYMFGTNAGVDVNFSWDECKVRQRQLNILWNVHKFLLDLCKENSYIPKFVENVENIEEKYIISYLHSTLEDVTVLLETYHLDEAISPMEDLFLELSRTYIQMVRDKSALGSKEDKEVVMDTIYTVLLEVLKMFHLVSPFISEAMYLNIKDVFDLKEDSISHFMWPEFNRGLIDEELEEKMNNTKKVIQASLQAREKAKLGLRWPVKEVIVVGVADVLIDVVKQQTNAKSVVVKDKLEGVSYSVKPDYGKIGPKYGKDSPKVIARLKEFSTGDVLAGIEVDGFKFDLDGEDVVITKEMVMIEHQVPEQYGEGSFKGGFVYLDKERTSELEGEGYARELMRKIQQMRKDAGLQKLDRINLKLGMSEEMQGLLNPFMNMIKEKVGADSLEEGREGEKFSIKGEEFVVSFDKL